MTAKPRVLHLAFEDPAKPGAGGGAVRTAEINRRLSDRFDITVVAAAYPGAKRRDEGGIKYRFVGLPFGSLSGIVSYFLCLPLALIRHRSDLVVEDFGAPVSTIGVPRFTRRPVIGMVQWLFAKEKTQEYRLPFDKVEQFGLRAHTELIAVSGGIGDELRRRNSSATVHVVPNGIAAHTATAQPAHLRSNMVFMGRLEVAQKGLDLLLEAFASVAPDIEQNLILAGDGPDRDWLVKRAAELGITHRIDVRGWVPSDERMQLLAGADFVVMPSRYETFGMVAAEALSVGTPVVAFDIPCLRELVNNDNGILVPRIDQAEFAAAIKRLASSAQLRATLSEHAPRDVEHLNWDALAAAQATIYEAAITRSAS